MNSRKHIGNLAEKKALDYLLIQGLTLREKNFRSSRGEIDLIMDDDETIVFIEVRSTNTNKFGSGLESIDFTKEQHILDTADDYLLKNNLYDKTTCRYDVISIDENKLNWIINAF